MAVDDPTEIARTTALRTAQENAKLLFSRIITDAIIQPGKRETEVDAAIYALSEQMFGVIKHWHKRIVRSGPNTLCAFRENPPDRIIDVEDVVFLDLGPVFEEWEADYGMTFYCGEDPLKRKICADLPILYAEAKSFFNATPDVTGRQMYRKVQEIATRHGWIFEAEIAGHIIGEFPHAHMNKDRASAYIVPENTQPLRKLDAAGRIRHWILEIKITDVHKTFAGFFEDFLTL